MLAAHCCFALMNGTIMAEFTVDSVVGSTYLPSDCQLVEVFIADGAVGLVSVVEHDGHAGLCHTCLALFVDQLLQVTDTHLQHQRAGLMRH